MADEPILFPISAPGIDQLIAAFEELGLSGEVALNLVNGALRDFSANADKTAAIMAIVNDYTREGGVAADQLTAALSRLDTATIKNAASNAEFRAALTASNEAVRESQILADLAVQQAIAEEEAHSAAVREGTNIRILAALEEEQAVSEALKSEDAAWSIHAAFLKEQAMAAATSINAAYDTMTASAASSAAAVRVSNDLIFQQTLADSIALDERAAASAQAARVSDDLRVQSALAAERAIADADAATAQAAKISSDLRMQAALEEEQAVSTAQAAEAAAVREATDLRMQAALEEEQTVSAAEARAAAAFKEASNLKMLQALEEEQAISAAMTAETAAIVTSTSAQAAAYAGLRENVVGAFDSMIVKIGAFIVAADTIHSVNAIDSIEQQLHAVLGAGNDTAAVFNKIAATANATQQPLEVVAKNFAGIYASIKETGGTVDQATGALDSLTKLLYATGTAGQAAQRVLHDFTEGLASGSLNGRQLTSSLMQAPALMEKFSEALGVNVETLTSHAQASQKAEEKVNTLRNAVENSVESVNKATTAHNAAVEALKKDGVAATDDRNKIDDLTKSRGNHTKALKTDNKELDNNAKKTIKDRQAINDTAVALRQAKDAQDDNNQSKLKAAEASAAASDALSREVILGVLNGQKLKDILESIATTATGTISGAFTVLQNKFEEYLKNTGDAYVVTRTFNVVLGVLGDLIPVIIPLFVLLAAAFAALKIQSIVAGFLALIEPLQLAAAAATVLDIALSPYILLGAALSLVIVGLITHFQEWGTVMNALQVIWNDTIAGWNVVVNLIVQAWTDFVTVITPVIATLMPGFNTLIQTANDLWTTLRTAISNAADMLTSKMNDAIGDHQKLWTQLGTIITFVWQQAVVPLINLFITGIGGLAVGAVQALLAVLESVIVVVNGIIAVVQLAIAAFEALAGAQSSAGNSSGGIGAARDGASFAASEYIGRSATGSQFTVPGSGGVDSRVMAVSPGEHVTVQTPEQYQQGKVNDGMPKFRDGGVMDLTGVKAAFTAAASDASVTGYQAVKDTDYYTNSAGTIYSRDSLRAQAAAIAAAKAAAEASAAAAAQAALNAATAQQQASDISEALGNSGGTTYNAPGPGLYGTTSGSSDATATATSAQVAKKAYAIQQDTLALKDAEIITKAGGTDKPTSDLMTVQQSQDWVDVNGVFVPREGIAVTTKGNVQEAYAKLEYDTNNPAINFRDGGTLTVPGSSGVDSRMIRLAVSPGEQLTVKTPQQQQHDSAGQGQLQTPNVVFNIKTDDANSFNKSRAQIASDLKRRLAKVA